MIEYGINVIGKNSVIFEPVTIGFPSRDVIGRQDYQGVSIGDNATFRSGTILYADVSAGIHFTTGHNVLVREHTIIGDFVSLGTGVIIEGNCNIGNNVSLQSLVYIPTNTTIHDNVFIGPNAVLTNDKYPPSAAPLKGPVIMDGASIGAHVTILPGVMIGKGALVAAGSVVTKDVPDMTLAIGSPARIRDLPKGAHK